MDATVAAGWIGLGGAVVGAGAAVLGGVVQQRLQAKSTQADRREERGHLAGEKALAELYQLRRHLLACVGTAGVPDECEPWRDIARRYLDSAELAVLLLPSSTPAGGRAMEVLLLAERFELAGQDRRRQLRWIGYCVSRAIRILSAHRGGDEIPEVGLHRLRSIVQEHDSRYEPWDGGDWD